MSHQPSKTQSFHSQILHLSEPLKRYIFRMYKIKGGPKQSCLISFFWCWESEIGPYFVAQTLHQLAVPPLPPNAGITHHSARLLFYTDTKHGGTLNTEKFFATKIIRFCVGLVIILNVLQFLNPSIIQVIHWHTELLRTQPICSYDLLQPKHKNKK